MNLKTILSVGLAIFTVSQTAVMGLIFPLQTGYKVLWNQPGNPTPLRVTVINCEEQVAQQVVSVRVEGGNGRLQRAHINDLSNGAAVIQSETDFGGVGHQTFLTTMSGIQLPVFAGDNIGHILAANGIFYATVTDLTVDPNGLNPIYVVDGIVSDTLSGSGHIGHAAPSKLGNDLEERPVIFALHTSTAEQFLVGLGGNEIELPTGEITMEILREKLSFLLIAHAKIIVAGDESGQSITVRQFRGSFEEEIRGVETLRNLYYHIQRNSGLGSGRSSSVFSTSSENAAASTFTFCANLAAGLFDSDDEEEPNATAPSVAAAAPSIAAAAPSIAAAAPSIAAAAPSIEAAAPSTASSSCAALVLPLALERTLSTHARRMALANAIMKPNSKPQLGRAVSASLSVRAASLPLGLAEAGRALSYSNRAATWSADTNEQSSSSSSSSGAAPAATTDDAVATPKRKRSESPNFLAKTQRW